MVEREALLALAERCEKATGPDRYIDYWAAFHCGFQHTIHKETPEAPAFTASLDAAMSLVPEGWWAVVDTHGRASLFTEDTPSGCLIAGTRQETSKAATPALALTAAALRARAAQGNPQ